MDAAGLLCLSESINLAKAPVRPRPPCRRSHLGCKVNRRLEECRPGLRGILIDQKTNGWVYLFEGRPIAGHGSSGRNPCPTEKSG